MTIFEKNTTDNILVYSISINLIVYTSEKPSSSTQLKFLGFFWQILETENIGLNS